VAARCELVLEGGELGRPYRVEPGGVVLPELVAHVEHGEAVHLASAAGLLRVLRRGGGRRFVGGRIGLGRDRLAYGRGRCSARRRFLLLLRILNGSNLLLQLLDGLLQLLDTLLYLLRL